MDRFREQIDSLYHNRERVMPVPLVGIAKDIGYGVYRFRSTFETLNISGIVNYNERKILLNAADFNMRQRFTLAHEIGHIVLRHHENGKSEKVDYREDVSNPSEENERNANRFAAELLMPEKYFKEKFEEVKSKSDSNSDDYKIVIINKLADYFITSYFTTRIRIKELGLLD